MKCKAVLLICTVLISACSSLKILEDSEAISFRINQQQIDSQKGLPLELIKSSPQHYLSLEINDTTIVQTLNQGDKLQIMLARGSRPVTAIETNYEIPYRMGCDATKLFEKADSGDRLIFFAVAADSIFCMLPIVQ